MKCPRCHEIVERSPHNRADRFVCKCGWRSWLTRLEALQEAFDRMREKL